MAKRRNQYAFPGQRPAQLDSMDQSRFWRRLDDLSREENSEGRRRSIDHLKASIRKVTEQARWISTQVCRFMPQYTLHEERHFLNVLAIMDALVPDEVMARFGEVIKNYFTQIGTNYYRSPKFNQEKADTKTSSQVVAPISIV
jgi:hypothetical protein